VVELEADSYESFLMKLDFWKSNRWRSKYVRIIGTIQDNTTHLLQFGMCFIGLDDIYNDVGNGFHIALFETFIHSRPMKSEIIIFRKLQCHEVRNSVFSHRSSGIEYRSFEMSSAISTQSGLSSIRSEIAMTSCNG